MSFNVYVKRRGENNMCPGASMHGKKSNHRVQKSKNVMKHCTTCHRGKLSYSNRKKHCSKTSCFIVSCSVLFPEVQQYVWM